MEVDFAVREGIARFSILDQGIGVYENVRARLGLSDVLAALQEISKGKVCQQPLA